MSIFEKAAKQKLRFASDRGNLTTEQLYDLTLTAIDKVARSVNAELKSLTEESFVELRPNPRKTELALQLDILKHIIADKLAEKEAAEKRVERENKRRILLEALESKENDELRNMSKEDLLKQLEAL